MSSISPRSYSIVEPHPHIPHNSSQNYYISTGRGGAGNAVKPSPSTPITRGADAQGPAFRSLAALLPTNSNTAPSTKSSKTTSNSTHRQVAMSGRGGAGNVFPSSERAIFSFDEELERQLRWDRDVAPVYHVGRGGAGNVGGSSSSSGTSSQRRVSAAQSSLFDSGMMRRRPSGDSGSGVSMDSETSRDGSESGADVFNRNVKKGWKKITGSYH